MVVPSVWPYPWMRVQGNRSSASVMTRDGIGPPPYWMFRRLEMS